MSDNPFITPDNPFGSYNLPFEPLPADLQATHGTAEIDMRDIHDQVDAFAGATLTPLGPLGVLRLTFRSSSPAIGPVQITFIADVTTMKNTAELLHTAARRAAIAATMLEREAGR